MQSSTKMCVETTLEILKDRQRLMMIQFEVSSRNMSDIVVTYIILYNLYITNKKQIEDKQIVKEN